MDWDDGSHYAALPLKMERINHISRATRYPLGEWRPLGPASRSTGGAGTGLDGGRPVPSPLARDGTRGQRSWGIKGSAPVEAGQQARERAVLASVAYGAPLTRNGFGRRCAGSPSHMPLPRPMLR